ncbi:MAG: HemK2/MTQ2 family protein methyltransferase [Micromonosporaceae bacterium]
MTDADRHTPMMSAEEVERIRRWHENAYANAQAEAGSAGQTFSYLGLTLHVPPTVQPITGVSELLGEAVLAEARAGDRVLDMGTGSGVNAILAATQGATVVAVDINPDALDAARRNAESNGVVIDVRHSDVFTAVDGEFDLIVFDPPFRWFAPRDRLELATTDHNYQAMTRFFAEARGHLTPGGRMLIFFGSSGDLAYLRHLMDGHGFQVEVVAERELVKDGQPVRYLTFRLT